jgi:hypothetical protein
MSIELLDRATNYLLEALKRLSGKDATVEVVLKKEQFDPLALQIMREKPITPNCIPYEINFYSPHGMLVIKREK